MAPACPPARPRPLDGASDRARAPRFRRPGGRPPRLGTPASSAADAAKPRRLRLLTGAGQRPLAASPFKAIPSEMICRMIIFCSLTIVGGRRCRSRQPGQDLPRNGECASNAVRPSSAHCYVHPMTWAGHGRGAWSGHRTLRRILGGPQAQSRLAVQPKHLDPRCQPIPAPCEELPT